MTTIIVAVLGRQRERHMGIDTAPKGALANAVVAFLEVLEREEAETRARVARLEGELARKRVTPERDAYGDWIVYSLRGVASQSRPDVDHTVGINAHGLPVRCSCEHFRFAEPDDKPYCKHMARINPFGWDGLIGRKG